MNLRLLSASCTLVGGLVLSVLLPAASAHADAEDDFKLARNLFRNDGDYATSATLFAGFIRDYPGNPHLAEARLLLARSFARSRRCVDAVPAFESFYDQHSNHLDAAEARRERADCLTILGEFSRAASGLEEVQRLYSESPFAAGALLGAASNFARAGDLPNAVRAYDKLLTNYASKPEARRGRYRLAQLRFAAGDATSALTLLASISQSAPRSDEARDALLLSGNIDLVLNHATGNLRRRRNTPQRKVPDLSVPALLKVEPCPCPCRRQSYRRQQVTRLEYGHPFNVDLGAYKEIRCVHDSVTATVPPVRFRLPKLASVPSPRGRR